MAEQQPEKGDANGDIPNMGDIGKDD